MVFSSFTFLWIFLPLSIILYYIIPNKCRNYFLLFISLLFYSWGEPVFICVILVSIILNWIFGIIINQYPNIRFTFLLLAITFNIGILFYYKYAFFSISIINKIFNLSINVPSISLPIGISFFTFQALSYIIDVYKGQLPSEKNFFIFALYISFFPQLIAGPIIKYHDINTQIHSRTLSLEKFANGSRRFIYGLGKKVVIANTLAYVVDIFYSSDDVIAYSCVLTWIITIFYSLQIYYDFSGYSDMAIGLGMLFGFVINENFNYPYTSNSIRMFWQKWHISLGSWLKEYIYFPLGGNRCGAFRTYLNLFIIFLITGLWHGASTTFVLWGIYHGIFSILERLGFEKFLKKHSLFSHIYTLLIVNFGWVLFRSDNLHQAKIIISKMIFPWLYNASSIPYHSIITNSSIAVAAISVLGLGIIQKNNTIEKQLCKLKFSYLELLFNIAIYILCIVSLASNSYNPFIYFRF